MTLVLPTMQFLSYVGQLLVLNFPKQNFHSIMALDFGFRSRNLLAFHKLLI